VPIYREQEKWIELAAINDRQAQKDIYEQFSPMVLSVCRRYINDEYEAEDVMIQSFINVFKNISTYSGTGSFKGWLTRIASNMSISHLRKMKKYQFISPLDDREYDIADTDVEMEFDADQLQSMIDRLPEGCKIVFTMYAIDGYKHQEIAETLSITEGTSKSQLSYARKLLKEWVYDIQKRAYEG
jgi:RNA polymerase sigma-70 factor, ECF subfamily